MSSHFNVVFIQPLGFVSEKQYKAPTKILVLESRVFVMNKLPMLGEKFLDFFPVSSLEVEANGQSLFAHCMPLVASVNCDGHVKEVCDLFYDHLYSKTEGELSEEFMNVYEAVEMADASAAPARIWPPEFKFRCCFRGRLRLDFKDEKEGADFVAPLIFEKHIFLPSPPAPGVAYDFGDFWRCPEVENITFMGNQNLWVASPGDMFVPCEDKSKALRTIAYLFLDKGWNLVDGASKKLLADIYSAR